MADVEVVPYFEIIRNEIGQYIYKCIDDKTGQFQFINDTKTKSLQFSKYTFTKDDFIDVHTYYKDKINPKTKDFKILLDKQILSFGNIAENNDIVVGFIVDEDVNLDFIIGGAYLSYKSNNNYKKNLFYYILQDQFFIPYYFFIQKYSNVIHSDLLPNKIHFITANITNIDIRNHLIIDYDNYYIYNNFNDLTYLFSTSTNKDYDKNSKHQFAAYNHIKWMFDSDKNIQIEPMWNIKPDENL